MIFEPTNITPSILTGTGTISANEAVKFQWQINGNSPMIAFQIDIYQNDSASTWIATTGMIEQNPPVNGKDKEGNIVPFEYIPLNANGEPKTWHDLSTNIKDGQSYKFKITQFYTETFDEKYCYGHNEYYNSIAFTDGKSYYFPLNNGKDGYVYFTLSQWQSYQIGLNGTNRVNYDKTQNLLWFISKNEKQFIQVSCGFTTSVPSSSQSVVSLNKAEGSYTINFNFLVQRTFSAIIARTPPTVDIQIYGLSDENTLATSFLNATATYEQAQNDSIQWVRWVLLDWDNNIVEDTGEIYTTTLAYNYNSVRMNGAQAGLYTLVCEVCTQNGVTGTATIEFSVEYDTIDGVDNALTVNCINRDNSTLISFKPIALQKIEGVGTPSDDWGTAANGRLIVNSGASVTWDTVGNEKMAFNAINANVAVNCKSIGVTPSGGNFSFEAKQKIEYEENIHVTSAIFSDDGKYLILGTDIAKRSKIYRVQDDLSVKDSLVEIGEITNSTAFNDNIFAFHPNGRYIVGGGFPDFLHLYKFESGTVTYIKEFNDLSWNFAPQITDMKFLTTDSGALYLIVTYDGESEGYDICGIFKVNGENYTLELLFKDSQIGYYNISISPDNKYIALGGRTHGLILSSENDSFNLITSFEGQGKLVFSPAQIDPSMLNGFEGYNNVYELVQSVKNEYDVGSLFNTVKVFAWGTGENKTTAKSELIYEARDVFSNSKHINTLEFAPHGEYFIHSRFYQALNNIKSPYANYGFFIGGSFIDGTPINSCAISQNGKYVFYYDTLYKVVRNGEQKVLAVQGDSQTFELSACGMQRTIKPSVDTPSLEMYTPHFYDSEAFLVNPNGWSVGSVVFEWFVYYNGDTGEKRISEKIGMQENEINAITLYGTLTASSLAVVQSSASVLENIMLQKDYTLSWGDGNYSLYMYAKFMNDTQAGTELTSYSIVRKDESGQTATVAQLMDDTIVKDYSIKSGGRYSYSLYAYSLGNALLSFGETSVQLPVFDKFTLLATEYNEADGAYHVVKVYEFSANIDNGTISNNNMVSLSQNFTPYPTRFGTSANYASGTLSVLIGRVDMQESEYINDTAEYMKELNGLSTTQYTLFLRDMKGNLRMVKTNGAIQHTITQSSRVMQTKISLPWVEVGSAEDVSIILTPQDDAWEYDEASLEVQFTVDTTTGVLTAIYPSNQYYGTIFKRKQEKLVANTPQDVTTANFALPNEKRMPSDGELTATTLRNKK